MKALMTQLSGPCLYEHLASPAAAIEVAALAEQIWAYKQSRSISHATCREILGAPVTK